MEVIATKTRTNRNTTQIAATYCIRGGGTTKRKTLNIQSVQSATDNETQQVVDHKNLENPNEDVVVNPTDSPPPFPPPLSPICSIDNEEQKSESSDEENNNDEEENDDDADEVVVFPNDVLATITNSTRWYSDNRATKQHLNGCIPVHKWQVQMPIGDWIGPGSNVQRKFSCL